MSKSQLFHSQVLVTCNSQHEVFHDAFLAVEGERIVDCGPWKKRPRSKAFREVDVTYGMITPGLFNLHTHLAMVLLRGIAEDIDFQKWLFDYILPVEKQFVSAEFVKLGAELAALECIRFGVTFAADMYYYEEVVAEVIDKMGMRVLLGEHVWDGPSFDCATPQDALDRIRKLHKKYSKHPRIFPSVNAHAPYTASQDTIRQCAALARELNIPAVVHLDESRWENDLIREKYGRSPTQYIEEAGLFDVPHLLMAHSVCLDAADRARLKDKDHLSVVLNPQCNAKLASGFAPVQDYLEDGIRFTMGTDGAASNNALDILSEMNFLAKIHHLKTSNLAGLPRSTIFDAATIKAAEAVGLSKDLGSLEPGKLADFIVIDVNTPHLQPMTDAYAHLIYSARGQDVDSTYVAGKPLMKNRKFLVGDAPKTYAKANALWKKISQVIR